MSAAIEPKQGVLYDEKTGIYTNTWPAPTVPNVPLFEYLFGSISFDDNRVLFIDHGKDPNDKARRSITFGQLKLLVHKIGAGLIKDRSLKQGDVVMILAPNSIDWVVAVMAAQFAGFQTALASPVYSIKELQHVCSVTEPKRIFTPLKLIGKATQAGVTKGGLRTISTDASAKGTGTPSMWQYAVSDEEARSAKPRLPKPNPDNNGFYDATAILAFSSGTTGLPKAVMMSNRNVVGMLTLIRCYPNASSSPSRVLTCLPFFHAMALIMHVLIPITVGSQVHIQVPFNPQKFLEIIAKEKIQNTSLVPPIMVAFSRLPVVNRKTFASVENIGCGGAPLDSETQVKIAEKTGADIAQGWGMSETTVGCLGIHPNMTPGTVGRVLPGIQAKLVDPETGKVVKRGERGELWVRGPNIFKGYHNNPQATKDTMGPDGFLKTGDVAVVTDKGEFKIVDRIKELIKYKGNQVAPAELEALLNGHPSIALSGVIGVWSKEQGTELPRAYVQLAADVKKTPGMEGEIQEWVKKRASHHKWLRGGVIIVPAVPAGPSGKLLRKELRAMAAKEAEQQQSANKEPAQARL